MGSRSPGTACRRGEPWTRILERCPWRPPHRNDPEEGTPLHGIRVEDTPCPGRQQGTDGREQTGELAGFVGGRDTTQAGDLDRHSSPPCPGRSGDGHRPGPSTATCHLCVPPSPQT